MLQFGQGPYRTQAPYSTTMQTPRQKLASLLDQDADSKTEDVQKQEEHCACRQNHPLPAILFLKRYLEDEAILENQICKGAAEDENGWQSNAPDGNDSIWLGELEELCNFKSGEVIN